MVSSAAAQQCVSTCTYCCVSEATTDDHVVPEGLFPSPPPEGYIKVPACYACNNGFSRDEEYFLIAVLGPATVSSPEAIRVLERLGEEHRGGRRKRAGLAARFLDARTPVDVQTPGGIYLGSAPGFQMEVERVNRVLSKMVRGLYFHEYSRRLPSDAVVFVEISPDLDRLRAPVFSAALAQAPKRLGAVFTWRAFAVEGAPTCTSWAMGFYDTILAIGLTGAAKAQPR